jgi:hypothetical protein
MNIILETILTLIIILIILSTVYLYMSWVDDQYNSYNKGELLELPKNIPPKWIIDYWKITWIKLQLIFARIY